MQRGTDIKKPSKQAEGSIWMGVGQVLYNIVGQPTAHEYYPVLIVATFKLNSGRVKVH